MAFDLIIRNGLLVRESGVEKLDLAIADEKIVEIAPAIPGDARETIDATGLHVFPGVIDPHVHFNEPGRTEWEGIATGSAALAAGGGTLFFDMPLNSSPPVIDGPSFDLKLAAMKEKSLTDFALWGGLTPNNLDKLEELAERGVIGFKAFMCDSGIDDFARADDYTLYEGMRIAARLGLPVAVHAENDDITASLAERGAAAGKISARDYLDSRPPIAEAEAISRAAMFAMETECKLHVVHVSHWLGVAVARMFAQGEDADITCETCGHYLELTDDDVGRIGATAKCAPPLRPSRDRDVLWARLAGGEIDFVASDHSPSPPSMKQGVDFFKVWGGIAGVQSTLSILLTRQSALNLPQVARLTSGNAAERFCITSKATIDVGRDADFALVDTAASYTLTREMLLDRHKLSPYVGRTFRGLVHRTLVRGHTVFLDGKIFSKPLGRLMKPARN